MSRRGLDVLSREECDALLGAGDFGRVVVKIGATISALPVFYSVIDGDIVFRTDPGTKLAAAVLQSQVTFEIDDANEGWSVMVVGPCSEVRAASDIAAALEALGARWPEGERSRIVRIHLQRVSGRRLRSPIRTDAPDIP